MRPVWWMRLVSYFRYRWERCGIHNDWINVFDKDKACAQRPKRGHKRGSKSGTTTVISNPDNDDLSSCACWMWSERADWLTTGEFPGMRGASVKYNTRYQINIDLQRRTFIYKWTSPWQGSSHSPDRCHIRISLHSQYTWVFKSLCWLFTLSHCQQRLVSQC